MAVCIHVTPVSDNRSISFGNLKLSHARCEPEEFKKHKDPLTGTYSLSCACGLKIELPDNGDAMTKIILTAINEQPQTLSEGSFSCDGASAITISPHPTTYAKL